MCMCVYIYIYIHIQVKGSSEVIVGDIMLSNPHTKDIAVDFQIFVPFEPAYSAGIGMLYQQQTYDTYNNKLNKCNNQRNTNKQLKTTNTQQHACVLGRHRDPLLEPDPEHAGASHQVVM